MNKVLYKVLPKSTATNVLVAFICLLLSGCVTTTTGGATVNERAALEAHLRTGMTYLQHDNRDAARRHFRKALELDRKASEALQGMAILHQLNGELDLAEQNFKRAVRGRAIISKSSVHLAYGRFLYEQQRYEDAQEQFAIAGEDLDYPGRSTALLYVGRSALKLGDKAKAKSTFERVVNLDRRQADAQLELAEIYFSERNYPQAKAYLDAYARSARHTPRSLWLGVRIERIFGNKDQEASYALALKNMHPYSQEYLEYKRLVEQ